MSLKPTQNGIPQPELPKPRQPLLWAALALAAGIVVGSHAWRPPSWWVLAITAFAASAVYFAGKKTQKRPWLAKGLALGTLVLLGALRVQVRGSGDSAASRILSFADGRELTVTAHVTADGTIKKAGFGGVRQRLDVETEEVTSEGHTTSLRAGVRLGLYAKEPKREYEEAIDSAPMRLFRYGERLNFVAKLRPPRNFRNPGAFDYEGYLAEHGIMVLASAQADRVEVLPGFAGTRLELWRTRVHRSIIGKIHALWPPGDAALIDAIVIGEEAFIDRDTRVNFQRSGTYHILVVSGMNVSILAFVVFWVLRKFRLDDLWASIATVLLSFAYAFLTDLGPPVWRAVLMMTLYLGARMMYRDRSMLSALGAAALGILIIDPLALFGASFQLTFLSVFIIAAAGAPILDRTSQPYHRGMLYLDSPGYDLQVAPKVAQFRLDLRMIAARLARFVGRRISLRAVAGIARFVLAASQILFISALMQVALALPMAYYFHRATVVGLPANVLAVPLTGVLMSTAVLAVALGYLSPALAKIPALMAGVALHGITGTVRSLGGLRVADLRVAMPEWPAILAGMAALALVMILARKRPTLAVCGLGALVAAAVWISMLGPAPQIQPGVLEVTAIDVGQADSTLLVSPDGKTMLVDAGGPIGGQHSEFDFGEDVVSPYLWWRGISRLDVVVITHGHSDHIGGMHAVLNNFRPRELWLGVMPPGEASAQIVRQARDLGITVVQHLQGDSLAFGETTVRVFWPPRDWTTATLPRNNDSLVMHIAYGASAVLLEGDAEKLAERAVAMDVPPADLLKLAHNGSVTSTTPELLAALKPRWR